MKTTNDFLSEAKEHARPAIILIVANFMLAAVTTLFLTILFQWGYSIYTGNDSPDYAFMAWTENLPIHAAIASVIGILFLIPGLTGKNRRKEEIQYLSDLLDEKVNEVWVEAETLATLRAVPELADFTPSDEEMATNIKNLKLETERIEEAIEQLEQEKQIRATATL